MAAGNFEQCLPIILHFEGGRSNDPADPGGRTNKGITQRTYDAYRARLRKPHNDVYAIADAEVADCYRRDYWDAVNGDALPPGEDLAIFDFAVNSGPARAVRVREMASKSGLKTDVNINNICANRLAFMQSLPTWPHFGSGWARRVAEVQRHGLAMAAGKTPAPSKVKPGHAGGVVVVAGGAVAGFAHWLFGNPVQTLAIFALALGLAIYVWSAAARARQTAAAKAHAPTVPTPTAPEPMSADAMKAALTKVSDAKAALALAIAEALKLRDAWLKQDADLHAEIADAEARLAGAGVDIASGAPPPPTEQSDHMEAVLK
jgi:lysozyme family protein